MSSIDWVLLPIGANFASSQPLPQSILVHNNDIDQCYAGMQNHCLHQQGWRRQQQQSQDVIKSSSCIILLLTGSVSQILLLRKQHHMISLRNQVHRLDPEIGIRLQRSACFSLLTFVCSSAVVAIVNLSSG